MLYRLQLKQRIPLLLAQWQRTLGVHVSAWGVKKMKTKWGSCNPASKCGATEQPQILTLVLERNAALPA